MTEGLEDRLHGDDVLAQPRPGVVELRAVATLDVGPHLCAESEAEAAAARLGQLPRRGRRHHGAAREGHGDARQHVDVGRHDERAAGEVGRAARLGHHQPRQTGVRRPPPELSRLAQRLRRQHGVELQRHGRRPQAATRRAGTQSFTLGKYSSVWSTVPDAA